MLLTTLLRAGTTLLGVLVSVAEILSKLLGFPVLLATMLLGAGAGLFGARTGLFGAGTRLLRAGTGLLGAGTGLLGAGTGLLGVGTALFGPRTELGPGVLVVEILSKLLGCVVGVFLSMVVRDRFEKDFWSGSRDFRKGKKPGKQICQKRKNAKSVFKNADGIFLNAKMPIVKVEFFLKKQFM